MGTMPTLLKSESPTSTPTRGLAAARLAWGSLLCGVLASLVACGGAEPPIKRDAAVTLDSRPDQAVDTHTDGALPSVDAGPDLMVLPDATPDQASPDLGPATDLPVERPAVDVAPDAPPRDTAIEATPDAPLDGGLDLPVIDAPVVDAPLSPDAGATTDADAGTPTDVTVLPAIVGTWHSPKNLGPGPHVLVISETAMIERTDNGALEILFTVDQFDSAQQQLRATVSQFVKGTPPYPMGTVFYNSYRLYEGGQKMDLYYGTTGYLPPTGGVEGNTYLSYVKVP
jgi:hypothetical protein